MSDESDRPLANLSTSHIIGFLGLLSAGFGAWVNLNDRVGKVEGSIATVQNSVENVDAATREYRIESTRRLERIEENQTKVLMAMGIKPEK